MTQLRVNLSLRGNDEDDGNNEQESSNESSEQENESDDDETQSNSVKGSDTENESEEHESEDDDQEEEKFVHTPTDDKDDDNLESKRGCSNVRCADAGMNDAQQGNENLETTQEQVVEDAHVTISTVTKKTEVPVTSSFRSSDLASKFLNFFSDIPHC
ncbi:hypothetical protein Tco_0008017 [Tanacetum coccineum]